MKITIMCIVLITIGCKKGTPNITDPIEIKNVKKAVLPEDKTLTIGEAIDGYRYAKKVEWEVATGKIDSRRSFVRARVYIDSDKIDNFDSRWKDKYKYLIVSPIFPINKDGSIDCDGVFWGAITNEDKIYFVPNEYLSRNVFFRIFYKNDAPSMFLKGAIYGYDDYINKMVEQEEYYRKEKEKRGIK